MARIFYKYNPHTLSFDKISYSIKQRVWYVLRQLFIGIFIGGCTFVVFTYLFDSPKEKQLKKENRLLLAQYQVLSKRIDNNEEILKELQERDDDFYRMMFNVEPVSFVARNAGMIGNRYEHLLTMANAKMVIATTEKLDVMTKQLYLQAKSYDELKKLAKTQKERIKRIPSVMPLLSKDLKLIGDGFGMRFHPFYRDVRMHTGIDMIAAAGTPIHATGDGTVESAGWAKAYGNAVVIDHGFGYKTRYAHCQEIKVQAGQKVIRGQIIATVGATGVATSPHVHYEVMVKNVFDNPAKYFFMDLKPEEYEKMIFDAENR